MLGRSVVALAFGSTWTFMILSLGLPCGALAEENAPQGTPQAPEDPSDDEANEEVDGEANVQAGEGSATEGAKAPTGPKLDVQRGPTTGKLTNIAAIQVPEGYGFVDRSQMPLFNRMTGNLDSPRDVGAILADDFIIFFNWDPVGYIKDDDKDELDAEALMKAFKESEGPSNEARAQNGLDALYIEGWKTKPFYDAKTNNLTWALLNRSGSNNKNINHEVRLLGRGGVMSATLVSNPEKLEAALPNLATLLEGFSFDEGQRYAEYKPGDRLATFGLTGLVLGGGVLAAAKTGLLAKLGKFIKVIAIAVVAAVAGIAKWLKGLVGGKKSEPA